MENKDLAKIKTPSVLDPRENNKKHKKSKQIID